MTVLLHELKNQVARRFDASMYPYDASLHRFYNQYEAMLYQDLQLLPATLPTHSVRTRTDIVAAYYPRTTAARFHRDLQHTFLSSYDPAGEDFSSQRRVEESVRCLSVADGIILLLDPLQIPGARNLAEPSTRLPLLGKRIR